MTSSKKVILYERYELLLECQDEKKAEELAGYLVFIQLDTNTFTSVKIETQGKTVVLRSAQPDKAIGLKRWAVALANDHSFFIQLNTPA